MVKSLENVDITRMQNFGKAKSYEFCGIALVENNFDQEFDPNNFSVFMCDCDQWGGDPAPCDDCR